MARALPKDSPIIRNGKHGGKVRQQSARATRRARQPHSPATRGRRERQRRSSRSPETPGNTKRWRRAIAEAERALRDRNLLLEDPAVTGDPARLRGVCLKIEETQKLIEGLYARWSELEAKKG